MTRVKGRNSCGYWECNSVVPPGHFLCRAHYEDWRDYLIDECPVCGRFKDAMYELCLDCRNRRPVVRWQPPIRVSQQRQSQSIEHSDAWNERDKTATHFFVYVLKLDGGKFYVGQTRELRERLSEHKDGKTQHTAGKNPTLQYFEILPTREAAEYREVELKRIADSNPREIRRRIIGLRDLISELRYE